MNKDFWKYSTPETPGKQEEGDLNDAAGYIASRELAAAVNVSITLGQPLLLTGEPGTGKTRLAWSVAHQLELGDPMVFHTKTTSTARDLFYHYDSLSHFRDPDNQAPLMKYIRLGGLGKAILLAMSPEEIRAVFSAKGKEKELQFLPGELLREGRKPQKAVVLIDEIDKAPRDLPNDVLNEFENMEFTIRELDLHFSAPDRLRPILILTSNSEKNLPDAFLRRCVYFHIGFPDAETLQRIVEQRFPESKWKHLSGELLAEALDHFYDLRKSRDLEKPPATAEFLAWLHVLDAMQLDPDQSLLEQNEALRVSYSVLLKNQGDLRKHTNKLKK